MSWITIHFVKNRKNGGSPPSDDNVINIINFIGGTFFSVNIIWLIDIELNGLIIYTVVKVNIE
jgi:hypothetical protein